MAWMAVMGDDSPDRYAGLVLGTDGLCLADFAAWGERPLAWGGSGAAALSLAGTVEPAQYRAIYRVGGAVHPGTGIRLVATRRPGLELSIAAHKSVAVLGVIGRADDMHQIMDAERDATMAYLDELTRERGSRRGRDGIPSPAEGLIYATSRQPASRAGDPSPADRVLLANVVKMADHKGGYKAPTTSLWRDHLHAATMVGRMASARRAVELGYAIVADDGPSGQLGHWAIAGVPAAVLKLFSKRALAIDAHMSETRFTSYQARQVAARATPRDCGRPLLDDLLAGWHAELASIGLSVADVASSVRAAASRGGPVADRLGVADTGALVEGLLIPAGRLGRRRAFSRLDVIVAATPALYGLQYQELGRVVGAVLASPLVVPLPRLGAAREPVFATITAAAKTGDRPLRRARLDPLAPTTPETTWASE